MSRMYPRNIHLLHGVYIDTMECVCVYIYIYTYKGGYLKKVLHPPKKKRVSTVRGVVAPTAS